MSLVKENKNIHVWNINSFFRIRICGKYHIAEQTAVSFFSFCINSLLDALKTEGLDSSGYQLSFLLSFICQRICETGRRAFS